MDWTPGGVSGDVEDRRDSSGGGGGGGGFGFGGGGGGGIGIVGFIILLVISLVTGRNFLGGMFSGGGSSAYSEPGARGPQAGQPQSRGGDSATPRAHPAGEDRDVQLISFVLDDAQKTWTGVFNEAGNNYRHAKLVIFRDATYSGCGTAQAATGPFYCPQDEKIYIDLGFWQELKRFGGNTGEFAQAYVITHELGHHVQKLLGIEAKEQRLARQQPSERNHLSVALELQADCFAGVWAHSTEQRGIVHPDDIAGALSAAAAVGDDHLQRMSGRAISPESFTHGSSAQREQWFRRGLEQGAPSACDTFSSRASNESSF